MSDSNKERDNYWLRKPIAVSVNRRLVNKNERSDFEAFSHGFQNVEVNAAALASLIKQGFAYSSQMKGGTRKGANFVASGVISLDVDGGTAPDVIALDPLVREGATIIYTTASHTTENPRYRIVFALEHPFEDPKAFRAANEALALRLGGDPSVVDAGRLFYGNSDAHIKVFNRGLSLHTLEDLVAQRIQAVRQDMTSERDVDVIASTTSQLRLLPDTVVQTALSGEARLQDLEPPTSLFCPNHAHADKNPSAFLVVSRTGQKGIHCSKCATTFWPAWEGSLQTSFDSTVKRVLEFSIKHEDRGPLAQFEEEVLADGTFRPSDDYLDMIPNLHRARVALLNQEFLSLSPKELASGITYIKSPKGTSKTGALEHILQDKNVKVLVVGHRKALLRQMAERFGLNCYLPGGTVKDTKPQARFAISLDSLSKVRTDQDYDYLVLDESEQVLAHMLSETMIGRRNRALFLLQHFARKAKHVIALDADLSWPTFRFLSRCKGHNQASIILNEFHKTRGDLVLHPDKGHLTAKVMQQLEMGGRCYVTSNRKTLIESLDQLIGVRFPQLKRIAITSDNSTTEEAQRILVETSLAADYDVILTSPSVSTGVDFTFKDSATGKSKALFHVFGFFEPLTLTHLECDQQLSRVRAPLSLSVYIDPTEFEYETNLEVVRHDLLESRLADSCIKGLSEDGTMIYDPEDPLLDLAGSVETLRRASINCLLRNFCAYREAQGWTIDRLSQDDKSLYGADLLIFGRQLADEAFNEALLTAKKLSDGDAMKIEQEISASKLVFYDDMRAFRRYNIEHFYKQPISSLLIGLDDRGKMRKRVWLFEQITSPTEWSIAHETLTRELGNPEFMKLLKAPRFRSTFLVHIMELAGLLTDAGLVPDEMVEKPKLADLVTFVEEHKAILETVFGAPLRKDFGDDPIRGLNDCFLHHAGLKLKKSKTLVTEGTKRNFYCLDGQRLHTMEQICSVRRQFKGTVDPAVQEPNEIPSIA